jgi:hypothetical protein
MRQLNRSSRARLVAVLRQILVALQDPAGDSAGSDRSGRRWSRQLHRSRTSRGGIAPDADATQRPTHHRRCRSVRFTVPGHARDTLRLRGSPLVPMVEPTDLRDSHHLAHLGLLHRPWRRRVLAERQVRAPRLRRWLRGASDQSRHGALRDIADSVGSEPVSLRSAVPSRQSSRPRRAEEATSVDAYGPRHGGVTE